MWQSDRMKSALETKEAETGSESEKVPPGVPILTAACDVTWYTPAIALDRTDRE